MTSASDALFLRLADQLLSDEHVAAKAIECVEAFTDHFNARDLAGMDSLLHFPHAILSDEKLVVWDRPGQLSAEFFDDLTVSTGWHQTNYKTKRIILSSACKVHLLVEYSRDDATGRPISHHQNIWIVTFDHGRWGIKVRSY
jgi:hypothetical protein